MTDKLDPYDVLQVSKNAEIEVIEAAYRRLARKYHPDTNPSIDATMRMQRINWAYEILRDPIKRHAYDRSQSGYARSTAPKPRSSASPRASRQGPQSPKRATPTSPRPQSRKGIRREKSFLQKYWLFIVLIGIFGYFLPEIWEISRDAQVNSSESESGHQITSQYSSCINWREAGAFDGERKCVLGRIVNITHEFDAPSNSDVWAAHYSYDMDNDFVLISVNRDISKWEGKCVAVSGTLFDRERIQEYSDNPQPSMIDSDPYDGRGFSIEEVPINLCN